MRLKLFSIRDVKAGCFLAPFIARSEVDAKRQLSAGFNDPQIMQTPVGQHPEDFDLYQVGSFEDESGVITPEVAPLHIAPISALMPAKAG